MQRHEPEVMLDNHAHSHVEILLPVGRSDLSDADGPGHCQRRLYQCVVGQILHRLSQIDRTGEVFIANLPLPELLSWSMPDRFLSALFTGQVISSIRSVKMLTACISEGGMMIIIHGIQNWFRLPDRNYSSGCADSLLQAGIWGLPPR